MRAHSVHFLRRDPRSTQSDRAPGGRPQPERRSAAARLGAVALAAGLIGCSASGIEEGIPSYAYAANGQLVPPPPPPQIGGAATRHVSARTLKAIEKLKQKEKEKAASKR
jgi:hypothetical protein